MEHLYLSHFAAKLNGTAGHHLPAHMKRSTATARELPAKLYYLHISVHLMIFCFFQICMRWTYVCGMNNTTVYKFRTVLLVAKKCYSILLRVFNDRTLVCTINADFHITFQSKPLLSLIKCGSAIAQSLLRMLESREILTLLANSRSSSCSLLTVCALD